MDKRFIIFIGLSVVVMYAWSFFMTKNTKPNQVVVKQESSKPEIEKTEKIVEKNNLPIKQLPKKNIKVKKAKLKNDYLELEAKSLGAILNHVIVKKYKDYVYSETIDLVDSQIDQAYTKLKIAINNEEIDLGDLNWEMIEEKSAILFKTEIAPNIIITKQIKLGKEYEGECVVKVDNLTDQEVDINYLNMYWGPGQEVNSYAGGKNSKEVVVLNAGQITKIGPKKKDSIEKIVITKGWGGMRDKYFCAIFFGEAGVIKSADLIRKKDKSVALQINLPGKTVLPQSIQEYKLNFYFGPKDYMALKQKGKNLHLMVSFGFFHVIGLGMLYILKFFYKITSNYGISIILLTLVIRAILWWPTQKSYTSMKQMQEKTNKMQPRLKTLKEVYKDNPTKLNEETMKLYKEYKINPVGGCLPMLLQMPVFFALFTTLNSAIELKGASFWLWSDLSTKDSLYILPIAMGLSMFIQQKISTPPPATPETATQQKMMLYLLPGILTFAAFGWPSGLLLYWVISNILSIAQQFFINQKKLK